jgi:hypothetical protein
MATTSSTPWYVPPSRPDHWRRDLELRLLFSYLPETLRSLLFPALRLLAVRRAPWREERALTLTAVLLEERRSDDARASGTLAGLRQALIAEVELGLGMLEMPLEQLSRTQRNYWLARRAARIGRLADDLARHPEARPLERELERALAWVRRQ